MLTAGGNRYCIFYISKILFMSFPELTVMNNDGREGDGGGRTA